MINELEIHNFKSIKDLTLPCKRFNIFIGEPNTGKSNILEALGLLSFIRVRQYQPDAKLDGFVRYERLSNLFYDDRVSEGLSVRCDEAVLNVEGSDGNFRGKYDGPYGTIAEIYGDGQTITEVINHKGAWSPSIKFYRRPAVEGFIESTYGSLLPPNGANLPSLLLGSKTFRKQMNLAFVAQGLRLSLPKQGNKIELLQSHDDVISCYPYKLASESQQRLVFYTAAIDTNGGAALLFEEPETHSFPDDIHYLAEVIERDENGNQYFVTTHSPYFLLTLLHKTPADQILLHLVYSSKHQTRVRSLQPDDLNELREWGGDIFANLGWFLEP